ncbi:outer membrane usher protein [Morganella psychrotolerans]|uniref:Fimbrial assembly protein n=1 Tax=Morganella psychrotolerans TaxID=368603 RepID=A0A1B8HM46_9GAMM|nr:outer membrane usher protein [Morganella psychrotolerans]OBU10331.1 fimbrial assembly protein [Morganella psychrotolerans]
MVIALSTGPRRRLTVLISFILAGFMPAAYSDNQDIDFNTDILDVNDKQNIDLSDFARAGYIMPGTYDFFIRVNNSELPDIYPVPYIVPPDDPKGSIACLSPALVAQTGLKPQWTERLRWWNDNQCLDTTSLPGMSLSLKLSDSVLMLTIPQAYLEYTAANWDPPSRWDEGISGVMFDYNLNAGVNDPVQGKQTQQVTGNGTLGANLGVWRARADWQGNFRHSTGTGERSERNWTWSQTYIYRAIAPLQAKLTMGETFSRSDIFDNFRYIGINLMTDDNMLPPNLRGYAPEVTGVAKTNAKITVSQQGRVIYETQVAPGPFRIQDINDAVSGKLDVRIEEQDGSVQSFQMDTANIPYLTRPGRVQYKLSAGQPSEIGRHAKGPVFGMGEFSLGVSNGWSLYGGSLVAGDYNAASLGVGRDLMAFGAISFDATQSFARLPREDKQYRGGSYRLSYSKRFEELDSQVTFAGYRFSERDFMSMNQFLDRRYHDNNADNNKELYTIMLSKQFRDIGLSTYLNYSHQTYWNRPDNDNYNLSLAKYMDIGSYKNINISLSAYRNKFQSKNDDGVYLNVSMPWGDRATISYNSVINRGGNSHNVSYFDRPDDNNSYRLGTGLSSNGKASADGYYMRYADSALVTASASHIDGEYTSASLSLQGGVTMTPQGGALHRINMPGSARLLVDTSGVAGVPVRSTGALSYTNRFGKAVLPDMNNYFRNSAGIDINKLPENAEARRSVQQLTLTEGAIGYRKFDVLSGQKAMATVRLSDGSTPPFGAVIMSEDNRELGIVNDGGQVYLSGINSGDVLTLRRGSEPACNITVPELQPGQSLSTLLLTCNIQSAAVAETAVPLPQPASPGTSGGKWLNAAEQPVLSPPTRNEMSDSL